MNEAIAEKLIKTLWPAGSDPATDTVYGVVDCARDPQIWPMVKATDLFKACLFAGNVSAAMLAAAPQVIKLTPAAPFTQQLMESGWGNSWGIFVTAARPAGIKDVRKHLRQFLLVKSPNGKKLLFRYYDPRVMRVYLPTCNEEECNTLFNPIVKYVMESANGESILEFDKPSVLESQKTYSAS